jgi:hypothetical protein
MRNNPLKAASNSSTNPSLTSQSPLQKCVSATEVGAEEKENAVAQGLGSVSSTKIHQIPSGTRVIGRPNPSRRPVQNSQLQSTRDIESKIRSIRRENDQLRQAMTIMSSSKDTELENLIKKWRSAARLAAEAVYGNARDKVNRMGGVEGLREQEKQKQELRKQWEHEDREYEIERRIKDYRRMVDEGEATEEDLERFIVQAKEKPEDQYLDDDIQDRQPKKHSANDDEVILLSLVV